MERNHRHPCCHPQKSLLMATLTMLPRRPQVRPVVRAPHLPCVLLHRRRAAPQLLQRGRGVCPSEPLPRNSFSFHISQLCPGIGRILQLESLSVICILPNLRKCTGLAAKASALTVTLCFSPQLMNPNCPQILWRSDYWGQHSPLGINLPLHLYERTRKSFVCVCVFLLKPHSL